VPIKPVDRPYTAFEANGHLYQFKRIPFGVTNGVASFQRIMDKIISDEKLEGTFVYIDNVTVCGHNFANHNHNLKRFMVALKKYNLTLNDDKCVFGVDTINLLGYTVKKGSMSPDPERLKPLLGLPIPNNMRALKRALGMFAHYSQWIASFSSKIHPLVKTDSFPLSSTAVEAFKNLKKDIANSAITTVDPAIPLIVETDASDYAIAASLRQSGRPVAFFFKDPVAFRTATLSN